jgi:hypothetical protein
VTNGGSFEHSPDEYNGTINIALKINNDLSKSIVDDNFIANTVVGMVDASPPASQD